MNQIVNFGQISANIPTKLLKLLIFQALKFLDQVQLELDRYPAGKLESDAFLGEGSAIATWSGENADSTCLLDPFSGGQCKAVQPCLFFNVIEFDDIKIRIIEFLPDTEKLNSITIA